MQRKATAHQTLLGSRRRIVIVGRRRGGLLQAGNQRRELLVELAEAFGKPMLDFLHRFAFHDALESLLAAFRQITDTLIFNHTVQQRLDPLTEITGGVDEFVTQMTGLLAFERSTYCGLNLRTKPTQFSAKIRLGAGCIITHHRYSSLPFGSTPAG
jgi:hypothetical protein